MTTVIYGLYCPVAKAIRYIGKTTQPSVRMRNHIGEARKSGRTTHKHKWIAALLARGLRPAMRVLQTVESDADWPECERRWIAYAVESGWPLTNLAAGGDGGTPLNADAKQRKLTAMGRAETRAKMRASAQARWSDPARKAQGLAALRTEQAKANHLASVHARATPEYRQKAAERTRSVWADPRMREKIVSKITPDVRKKVSEAAKRMWQTSGEEKKASMLSNLRSKVG